MDAGWKNAEKRGDEVPADSDDGFKCEEVSVEDECSLREGEEDLEATVKAIWDRAEGSARPRAANSTSKPPALVDFLSNFLFQMGMTETLDCFQTEWSEMMQKGLLDADALRVTPDVYIENQRLENELRTARREMEEYRCAASAAAGTLGRVQKTRDFHRMQHKQVVQERNRLIEELRKVKAQCNSYEPALKRMNEKYQAVLKQVMLAASERDQAHHDTLCEGGQLGVGETAPPVIQPRPPASQ
ncbi:sperm-associated antigen 16 protein-like [Archocentrus centrarchus]|uniref:sperm-associated antigen 16 protein-like n=1 Tax=Archocentrus centrarchus TaxID=63155 RepID=UPI0011EA2AE9|nr:sperm-associated antigen 16 protein-like [Archocentrus centrarchus]